MDNSQVNVKELYNITTEILSFIDKIYLELDEIKKSDNSLGALCRELKEMDGKKVAVNGISTDEEISPQTGFKRCHVYGVNELEESIFYFQGKMLLLTDTIDIIYKKVKLARESSESLVENVKNVENVLSGGAEVMVFQDYMNQQNKNVVSKEQVLEAIQSNFEQNRSMTEQVNHEIYLHAYEKLQGFLSNSGGDRL